MGDVRLTLPRVLVIRDGHDDLELQITNPDLLRWDTTRAKHRWPDFRSAPNLWLTFIAWAAARRTGAIVPELKWETWSDQVLEVRNLSDDDAEDDDGIGTPFPEALEPGSS